MPGATPWRGRPRVRALLARGGGHTTYACIGQKTGVAGLGPAPQAASVPTAWSGGSRSRRTGVLGCWLSVDVVRVETAASSGRVGGCAARARHQRSWNGRAWCLTRVRRRAQSLAVLWPSDTDGSHGLDRRRASQRGPKSTAAPRTSSPARCRGPHHGEPCKRDVNGERHHGRSRNGR